jgi:hypothetical protein
MGGGAANHAASYDHNVKGCHVPENAESGGAPQGAVRLRPMLDRLPFGAVLA